MARAWVDPAYKARLLSDGSAAIAELGFTGTQGEDMIAVDNTAKVHNLVVCTLCSCDPWSVLGLPPSAGSSKASTTRWSGDHGGSGGQAGPVSMSLTIR